MLPRLKQEDIRRVEASSTDQETKAPELKDTAAFSSEAGSVE
jgi:hypothetical protein